MGKSKLLLVSLGLSSISGFIGKPLLGLRLAFISTAGKPFDDASFVERDRIQLAEMGFDIYDVPLEGKQYEQLKRELEDADVVFVAGGNTFYLLQEARASGFDRALRELVERGVPYVGASAGALLVGPDTEPVTQLDDPGAAPHLKDFAGIGLVNFVVLPHYGDEQYEATYASIIRQYKPKYTLIPLRNDQAVIVVDGDHQIVTSE